MQIDRHDLPHPIFSKPPNGINSIENGNSKSLAISRPIPGRGEPHADRRQSLAPQSQAGQGRFAAKGRAIPLGGAPINRKIAVNRGPGRINKTERII
ncbi:hypothetical protein [Burkholderia ubonensis]|uniref:hypothetical protein n=1 Tax=Burkholderia ubonensis TaxID=101571 RepID=UPI001E296138|nr:hypothetical protein [Burkholderia ubonensis]